MTTPDTRLGGARRDFPSTCWSRFDAGLDRGAVEELSRHYWKPIYAYIRTRWAKSSEDAKDLTQGFFVWMIESDFLSRADRNRGRFRGFVKVALEHFLSNEARDAQRLKRGGGQAFFPIDESTDGFDPKQQNPEEALDEAWRTGLLLRAEGQLDEAMKREGREVSFRIFRDYCLVESGEVNYRELASRHGVSEGEVLVHLRHARKRFRDLLTDLVAETVRNADELADELKQLFGEGG